MSRKGIWYAKSIETNLQFLIPDKLQAKMKSWSVPKVYSLVGKNEAEFKELLKEMDDLMKRKVPPSNTPTTPASASAADGGSSTPVGGDNALSGSSGDDIMADFRRDLSTLVKVFNSKSNFSNHSTFKSSYSLNYLYCQYSFY